MRRATPVNARGPAARRRSGKESIIEATTPSPGDAYVQSFARGLSVITAFNDGSPRRTLTEVATATGLTRAGARRILLTLVHLGYVLHDGRHFCLSPKILRLGFAYLSSLPFWNIAEPVMEALVGEVHESCSASVLDGPDIVYVMRVPTQNIMAINLSVGSRLPAFCSSMGRVLLAGLDDGDVDRLLRASDLRHRTPKTETRITYLKRIVRETRERGFAIVDQELEEGLVSLAVPITHGDHPGPGRTIAAMNVSGQANRTPAADMERRFLAPLKAAARRISGLMDARGRG